MNPESEYHSENSRGADVETPTPSTPAPDRREVIMERLDTKVEIVVGIQEKIEALANEHDPTTIQRSLDDLWTSTRMLMSPETMNQFDQLQVIEERLRNSNDGEAILKGGDEYLPDQHQALRDQQKMLRREARTIMEDEEVQFVINVDSVLKSLHHKQSELTKLRQQSDATIEAVNRRMGEHPLVPTDIVQTIETPFDTTLVLTDYAYSKKRDRNSLGMHFQHTPFSIARQHAGVETTIRHERVHNVLERADGIGAFTDSEKWEGFRKDHAEAKTELERSAIESQLLKYRPDRLLDRMHDELLAELGGWESRGMPMEKIPDTMPKGIDATFASYAMGYSTAGYHASLIAGTYNRIADRCSSPERKQQLLSLGAEFQQGFTRALEHMRLALVRAPAIGQEVSGRLHVLMFVLPPSKFRHLDRYLESNDSVSTK